MIFQSSMHQHHQPRHQLWNKIGQKPKETRQERCSFDIQHATLPPLCNTRNQSWNISNPSSASLPISSTRNNACKRNLHLSRQHDLGIPLLKQNITDKFKKMNPSYSCRLVHLMIFMCMILQNHLLNQTSLKRTNPTHLWKFQPW